MPMIVGVCRITLHLPHSASLKDKRQALRRALDRTRRKFQVAAAEVGDNDLWQRGVIGLAVVGNDERHVASVLQAAADFVESLDLFGVTGRDVEILHYGGQAESARTMAEAQGLPPWEVAFPPRPQRRRR